MIKTVPLLTHISRYLAQYSISIPPENVGKPMVFQRFYQVYIEMEHWAKMG